MRCTSTASLNFWQQLVRHHFAQLHPPLIERVDAPEHSLIENPIIDEMATTNVIIFKKDFFIFLPFNLFYF